MTDIAGLFVFLLFFFVLWKIGNHSAKRIRRKQREKDIDKSVGRSSDNSDTSMAYLIMDDLDKPRNFKYQDPPERYNHYDDGGPDW